MDNIGFEPMSQARISRDSCVFSTKLITPIYLITIFLSCFSGFIVISDFK